MKNKELLMKLLIAKKPIRVFIEGDDFGIYTYDETKKRYQGVIGYIEVEDVLRVINGDKELDHLQIEGVNYE